MSSFSVPSWLLRSASWKEYGLDRRLLDSVAFGAGKSAVLSAICGVVSAKSYATR
jgi:hypothetical protein